MSEENPGLKTGGLSVMGSLNRAGPHLLASILALMGMGKGFDRVSDASRDTEKHPIHPALKRSRKEKRKR